MDHFGQSQAGVQHQAKHHPVTRCPVRYRGLGCFKNGSCSIAVRTFGIFRAICRFRIVGILTLLRTDARSIQHVGEGDNTKRTDSQRLIERVAFFIASKNSRFGPILTYDQQQRGPYRGSQPIQSIGQQLFSPASVFGMDLSD